MFGFYWVGVAFWIFMAAVVIAEESGKTKRRRADLDLIRFAIDKGQPLTPALVQQVLARRATNMLIGGLVTIASGVGVMVFALFLSRVSNDAPWVVAGGGAITICVGIGLMISHKVRPRTEPTTDLGA